MECVWGGGDRVVRKDLGEGSQGGSNIGIWGKSVFQAERRASAKILR